MGAQPCALSVDDLATKLALHRLLGLTHVAEGLDSAKAHLEQALRMARAIGMRLEEGRALAALARTGLADDPGAARAEAQRIFEACAAARDLAELTQGGAQD